MFSRARGAAIRGIQMVPIVVEADVSEGLPSMDMVGLLNSEVREAKERVRTAIKNSGIYIPPKRTTISMSPADLRKEGGNFDLPIAVAILQSLGVISSVFNIEETLFAGELSLDGSVRGVRGILPIALSAAEWGCKRFVVPDENCMEAAVVKEIEVIGVKSLKEVIKVFNGEKAVSHIKHQAERAFEKYAQEKEQNIDFSEINGQESLKRAALVAAAGGHNMFLMGPPGSGKTMVALRMGTILPDPGFEECIEITKIHSVAGELNGRDIVRERPFRSPHHTITGRAMLGGGVRVKPGEITLAHKGVLFLDELAEFKREVLEVLRQPLENQMTVINRTSGRYIFPADIMLVAATNPCRCGYYPDRKKCRCTEQQVRKYIGKISGPIINRMDIMVNAPLMSVRDMQMNRKNVTSGELKKRVEAARLIQHDRYKGTAIEKNARLDSQGIKKYCYLGAHEKDILAEAFEALGISARTYYKTIKVARTVADLDGKINIEEKHIAEAVGYRPYI